MTDLFGSVALRTEGVPDRQIDAMAHVAGAGRPSVRALRVHAGLALGHAGTTTMAVSDGFVVVSDGHVDNRAELGAELGMVPTETAALSPSELVLRACVRWEERAFDRLIGEFTAAVWSERRQRLVIGTAAPLAPPLFYAATRDRLTFASRIRVLHVLPDLERTIDEHRLAGFLIGRNADGDRSFFDGVRRLLPGHLLVVDGTGWRVDRWWNPSLQMTDPGSDEASVEAFSELLRRVVSEQLGDGSPGVMLSGGLDSGAVAACAAAQLQGTDRRLIGLTEVPPAGFAGPLPPGRYADETPRVRELARMHPALDVRLVHTERGLLDDLDALYDCAETPFRNFSNRGWIEQIYADAAEAGITTLLSGEHGNLAATWDGFDVLSALIGARRPREAMREARAMTAERGMSGAQLLVREGLLPLLPDGPAQLLHALRHLRASPPIRALADRSLITPHFAAEHGIGISPSRRPRLGARLTPLARLRLIVNAGVSSAQIHAGFRRCLGVTTRTPLADRRLVEFCLRVPAWRHASGGRRRVLITRAMEGRLPPATLAQSERGLQAAAWFEQMTRARPELLAAVADFESDPLLAQAIDLPRAREMLERWPAAAPAGAQQMAELRGALATAISAGTFVRWAQRAPAPGRG